MKRKSEFNFEKDAKVLIYDLEVSPALMRGYGYYDPKIIEVVEQPKLLSVAWKWLGDKEVHCETIADYNEVGKNDDRLLIEKLWHLLDKCSVSVAYNGKRFDDKMAKTFFIENDKVPPSPYKVYDPLQTARGFFRFGCNKLDYLGKLLIGFGKTEETYSDCWKKLMDGDKKERKQASKTMSDYNKNDVVLLENVYLKLRPWATNHPNMALISGYMEVCPRCGCNEGFTISKYRYTGSQVSGVQYQCKHCGSYVTRPLDKEEREALKSEGKLKSEFRNLPA